MKNYTVSIYLSIAADTEEEAREIAFNLEVIPKTQCMKERYFGIHKIQKWKKNHFNQVRNIYNSYQT
jgi:hypothetical protein